jgi:uncharacterized membrane protein YfcA
MGLGTWIGVAVIGFSVGFISGMFGKGGSAIATPMLYAVGVPAFVAVGSPLPASIPSTLLSYSSYHEQKLLDRRVFRLCCYWGIPATVIGAVATHWISGTALVRTTDVIIILLGARFLLGPTRLRKDNADHRTALVIAIVAVIVGVISGLLANSGGFLLAPLFMEVLDMKVKPALATSLLLSAILAIPGSVVHAALGHVNWWVVLVFAVTSLPLARLGARVAIQTGAAKLERIYGAAIAVLGVASLFVGRIG